MLVIKLQKAVEDSQNKHPSFLALEVNESFLIPFYNRSEEMVEITLI